MTAFVSMRLTLQMLRSHSGGAGCGATHAVSGEPVSVPPRRDDHESYLRWLYAYVPAATDSDLNALGIAGYGHSNRSDGAHNPTTPRRRGRDLQLSCRSAAPWSYLCLWANLNTQYIWIRPGHLLLQQLLRQRSGLAQLRASRYLEWLEDVLD